MSEVIDLKPGVDFFPSKRERRSAKRSDNITSVYKRPGRYPRRGQVGKRFPVSVDLTAIIEAVPNPLVRDLLTVAAVPNPLVRDLLTVAAKEFMRVNR
jgi:hypothetical protein